LHDPGSTLAIFAAIALAVAAGYLISAGAGLACITLFAGVGFGLGFLWKRNAWRWSLIGQQTRHSVGFHPALGVPMSCAHSHTDRPIRGLDDLPPLDDTNRPRQQNDRADYNPRPDTGPALPAVSKKVKPDESKGIDQNKQND
jgi:hypothetical protein